MRGNIVSPDNELIRKRRQKKAVKRTIILTMLIIAVLVTLCLKLSYFDISSVKIINNNIVNSDEILNMSKINIGTNIFYINKENIRTNVLNNPYILKAEVKRKLPNTIIISVSERQSVFYGLLGNKYIIIDNNGIALEEKEDISNMRLTKLQGINFEEAKLGEVIPTEDKRKIEYISIITELIKLNSSGIEITSVDLSDSLNIIINCGDISIRLGNTNIEDKLNLAFNVIESNNLKDQKGYFDLSFEGNPVVFVEQKPMDYAQ